MNSSVRYTLNELGASIMAKQDEGYPPSIRQNKKPGDVIDSQLWVMASDFGEVMRIGEDPPFRRGVLEIKEMDSIPSVYGEIEVDGKKYVDVEYEFRRHACCPVSEDGKSAFVEGEWLYLP